MEETLAYFPVDALCDIGFVYVYAKYKGRWVFCFHKRRQKWECPGGHVEAGEDALSAASRELFEETGAIEYTITSLWDYSFSSQNHSNNGRTYFADIKSFGELLPYDMERIGFFDDIPENVTYDRARMRKELERIGKLHRNIPDNF